jgi:hypothetical protein
VSGFPGLERKGNAGRDGDDGVDEVLVEAHDADEVEVEPVFAWRAGEERPEDTETGVESE